MGLKAPSHFGVHFHTKAGCKKTSQKRPPIRVFSGTPQILKKRSGPNFRGGWMGLGVTFPSRRVVSRPEGWFAVQTLKFGREITLLANGAIEIIRQSIWRLNQPPWARAWHPALIVDGKLTLIFQWLFSSLRYCMAAAMRAHCYTKPQFWYTVVSMWLHRAWII